MANGDWIWTGTVDARDSLPAMEYLRQLEKSEDYTCIVCKKEIDKYDRNWVWTRSEAVMTGLYHSSCKSELEGLNG